MQEEEKEEVPVVHKPMSINALRNKVMKKEVINNINP